MRLTCNLSSMVPRGQTWLHVAIQVLARLLALLFTALTVFLQLVCGDATTMAYKECDTVLVAGIYALVSGAIGNLWMFCLAVFTFVFALDLVPNGLSANTTMVIFNVYLVCSALVALWICRRQFCASESEARTPAPYVPVASTGDESIEMV